MRCCQFVVILFCSLGLATLDAVAQGSQAGKVSDSRTSIPAAPEPLLTPNTPVITMHGLCQNQPPLVHLGETTTPYSDKTAADPGGASSSECKTVMTRSEFENLVNAINPNVRAERRLHFAEDYPETVLYAEQARQLGLDKTPEFQELAKFRTLEALSQIYKHYMQAKAAEVSDAEVEKFYKENQDRFELFALKRVFVPKGKVHKDAHAAVDSAADEAEMKNVAEKIRAELVAGGDFDVLQDKAYKAAGDNDSVLETDLGNKWNRDNLPPGYLKVVSKLQPGQVADPVLFGDGWYIFKLISKQITPLSEARAPMQVFTINDLVKSLKKNINSDVNRAYFQTGASKVDALQGAR